MDGCNPRVNLDEDAGTLDDFCATDVKLVHFEAIDDSNWYATIELSDGQVWQLNFGCNHHTRPGRRDGPRLARDANVVVAAGTSGRRTPRPIR